MACGSVLGGLGVDQWLSESGNDTVARRFGPIDVRIVQSGTPDPSRDLGHLEDRIRHTTLDNTDGLLTLMTADVRIAASEQPDEAIEGCATDVDFASVRHFGPDPAIAGLADARSQPRGGNVALGEPAADRLGVAVGDTVSIDLFGSTRRSVVSAVVEPVGVAGYCDVLVSPAALLTAWQASSEAEPSPLRGELLLSADGGLFDADRFGPGLADDVRNVLADSDIEGTVVDAPKSDVLSRARERQRDARPAIMSIAGAGVLAGVMVLMATFRRRRVGGVEPRRSPQNR